MFKEGFIYWRMLRGTLKCIFGYCDALLESLDDSELQFEHNHEMAYIPGISTVLYEPGGRWIFAIFR